MKAVLILGVIAVLYLLLRPLVSGPHEFLFLYPDKNADTEVLNVGRPSAAGLYWGSDYPVRYRVSIKEDLVVEFFNDPGSFRPVVALKTTSDLEWEVRVEEIIAGVVVATQSASLSSGTGVYLYTADIKNRDAFVRVRFRRQNVNGSYLAYVIKLYPKVAGRYLLFDAA